MGITHNGTPVTTVFVHCSATRATWMSGRPLADKVAEIRRWHVEERKWKDIGYHWIIDRDGTIAKGRSEGIAGSHVAGHNTGSIGICLIGGHGSNENDPFDKNFTPEQDAALRGLIEEVRSRANIKRVRGHNEVSAKACPGFNVARWHAKKGERRIAESTTMQASAAQIASGAVGGVTAVSALDGNAQIVALVICAIVVAGAAWIMRERLREWARGRR